jgi:hypothetical protein
MAGGDGKPLDSEFVSEGEPRFCSMANRHEVLEILNIQASSPSGRRRDIRIDRNLVKSKACANESMRNCLTILNTLCSPASVSGTKSGIIHQL